MLALAKYVVVLMGFGAALSMIAWSFLGRALTPLWFGSIGGTFTCKADVENALDDFLAMQLYSAIAGAVIALGLFLLLRRGKGKPVATGS
jgi:hypothetical protein